MLKMPLCAALKTNSFKTMTIGFMVMMSGMLFLAFDASQVGHWLAALGVLIGFVGFVAHTRLFLKQLGDRGNK